MHTLLLTLSAWGRGFVGLDGGQSATIFNDAQFHFTLTAPKDWYIDREPVFFPALRVGITPKLSNDAARKQSKTYIKVAAGMLLLPSLEDYLQTSFAFYEDAWAIETTRDFEFLGAPAKDVLLRQMMGNSTTKIRKIFTVRKTKDAQNVFVFSFSAPPDEYDALRDTFDAALQSISFL
ncbi:MAG: hypothetical protein EAZ92_10650 [Candidatus Kapaibacterium sp.]|nr:MAG: hypothetical protein EAZ92_10650 [Candidatus Kapabacteria bacterium]